MQTTESRLRRWLPGASQSYPVRHGQKILWSAFSHIFRFGDKLKSVVKGGGWRYGFKSSLIYSRPTFKTYGNSPIDVFELGSHNASTLIVFHICLPRWAPRKKKDGGLFALLVISLDFFFCCCWKVRTLTNLLKGYLQERLYRDLVILQLFQAVPEWRQRHTFCRFWNRASPWKEQDVGSGLTRFRASSFICLRINMHFPTCGHFEVPPSSFCLKFWMTNESLLYGSIPHGSRLNVHDFAERNEKKETVVACCRLTPLRCRRHL